ncbi:hypothetical protein HBH98_164010 [Parastagonospora nodorum]|nr:hypothetical protein HBI09_173620 [Parastagonospora nodorum]KAH4178963.1 hypothetical protein HBH43_031000 [Parastagonospora nodorum]KAH4239610.1 hypothetical protein HBI06_032460 [Parastagonospora nodorum]KAH4244889.1 hypothetical protein HBI05_076900 [Parastagonospora nodorum]KAH4254329.1 hypothetical protein HBI03_185920 [Parastagonospora nodorum]
MASRRTQNLEQKSQDRRLRIINDKIGKYRTLGATVTTQDTFEGRWRTDDDLVSDMKDQLEAGTALAFWADGSVRKDEKWDAFLGAGVAWQERREDGNWEWQQAEFELGQDTGESSDTELFAVAAALGLTVEKFRGEGSAVRAVRIFSDCRSLLLSLERGTTMTLGPVGQKTWALQDIFDHTNFLVGRGVTVQLVWQKGHAQSAGNCLADKAARKAALVQLQLPTTKKSKWKKMRHVPAWVTDLGRDSVNEWWWVVNKALLLSGRVEGDDEEVDEDEEENAPSEGSEDMDFSE